jgi:hypothetical protein
VIPWTLLVLCWSGLARAQCSKDTECKGERICEDGQCVAPPPGAAPAVTPAAPAPAAEQPAVAPQPAAAPADLAREPDVHFFDEERPRSHKPAKRIGNPALMTGGIIVTAAGPTLWMVGVLTMSCDRTSDDCDAGARFAGFFLGGLALIGGGIPMIVIGAKRVPVGHLSAVPWVGPREGGLQLRLDV